MSLPDKIMPTSDKEGIDEKLRNLNCTKLGGEIVIAPYKKVKQFNNLLQKL